MEYNIEYEHSDIISDANATYRALQKISEIIDNNHLAYYAKEQQLRAVVDCTIGNNFRPLAIHFNLQLRVTSFVGDIMNIKQWQAEIMLDLLKMKNTVSVYLFTIDNCPTFWVEVDDEDFELELSYYKIYNDVLKKVNQYFDFMVYGLNPIDEKFLPQEFVKVIK